MIYNECCFFDVAKEGLAINKQALELSRRLNPGENLKILVCKNISDAEKTKLSYFCDIIQTAGICIVTKYI